MSLLRERGRARSEIKNAESALASAFYRAATKELIAEYEEELKIVKARGGPFPDPRLTSLLRQRYRLDRFRIYGRRTDLPEALDYTENDMEAPDAAVEVSRRMRRYLDRIQGLGRLVLSYPIAVIKVATKIRQEADRNAL